MNVFLKVSRSDAALGGSLSTKILLNLRLLHSSGSAGATHIASDVARVRLLYIMKLLLILKSLARHLLRMRLVSQLVMPSCTLEGLLAVDMRVLGARLVPHIASCLR